MISYRKHLDTTDDMKMFIRFARDNSSRIKASANNLKLTKRWHSWML